MSGNGGESTDVVEIDAIGVDEWEHEQHTPRAMDENLAALVKQSSSQSAPVRAPTLDDGWEADARAAESAEPAKQRTTTNTVARPAPPKTKTMAMPTVPREPVAPKPNAVPQPIARVETKAIVSPTPKTIAPSKPPSVVAKPPAAVTANPTLPSSERTATAKPATKSTRVNAEPKPAAKPPVDHAEPTPVAKPAAVHAEPTPVAKPAAVHAEPTPVAKPASKPTAVHAEPTPVAKPASKPAAVHAEPTPVAKPASKPAAVHAEPTPVAKPAAKSAGDPKPAPPPLSAMTLPAWPPAKEFEDWDSPQSAATSVGNRVSPSRPVSTDFKSEDSVIVDLNAAPTADKPRRPQSYPVIQTSEQNPSTSGVFVMPTAAQPNATQVAPERASAPELPPPPIAGDGARASSPGWNTPLPTRLPGEPIAAPAAPSWPSASSFVDEPRAPLAHEPAAPLVAKRSVVAALARSRGVVIALAGAAVLAIVFAIGSRGSPNSHDSKQATIVATSARPTAPTASADSTSMHVTPARAGAMPAPTPSAAVEAVAPSRKVPAKTRVVMRRFSRSKKPVVVDYDKKSSSSPLDADEALAQARAAYSIGNQHLFAGEGREAVAAYRNALSIYPSYVAGYRGLGLAFAQLDDKSSAIAAFKTYVKLAPSAKDVALIQKRIRNLSVR